MRRVTVRGERDTGPERTAEDRTGSEKERRRQLKTGSRM